MEKGEEGKESIPPIKPFTTEEMAGSNHNHPTRGETLEEYSKRTGYQPQTMADPKVLEEFPQMFGAAMGGINRALSLLTLSPTKLQFCQQQKRTYTRIYNALKRSNLLFTSAQWEMMGSIRAHIRETTGHPSSHADVSTMKDITSLLNSLSTEDHRSSKESGSMVINHTIERQVESLIEELSDLVWEESGANNPLEFHMNHRSISLLLFQPICRRFNNRRVPLEQSSCSTPDVRKYFTSLLWFSQNPTFHLAIISTGKSRTCAHPSEDSMETPRPRTMKA